MARSYSRDSAGRFSAAGRKGDVAKTVQQASREKKTEQQQAKEALSGGKLGTKGRRNVNRNRSAGAAASTKRQRNIAARAKARFT